MLLCGVRMLKRELLTSLQYWDDPADGIQEREGTLLPLWRFTAGTARGRHVTSLCWNPAYPGEHLFRRSYWTKSHTHFMHGVFLTLWQSDCPYEILQEQTIGSPGSGLSTLTLGLRDGHALWIPYGMRTAFRG
jgi:hypothetical protein